MSQLEKKDMPLVFQFVSKDVENNRKKSEENGIFIFKDALDFLEIDGFDITQKGTEYIAKFIDVLYHEKELLLLCFNRRGEIDGFWKDFWNLNDRNNPHYTLYGDSNIIIPEMRKSIKSSLYESDDTNLNELIYQITDTQIDRRGYFSKELPGHEYAHNVSYRKILLGINEK